MIISHTHQAIFIHVPKTAGTSITALLEPYLQWNDLVLGGSKFGEHLNLAYQSKFGLSKHIWARDMRAVVGDKIWIDYFSFAIVRHPFARIISFYNWKKMAVGCATPESPIWAWPATEAYRQSRSFSEFIRHEKFLASNAGQPQADWLCDKNDNCIVDFVGRFEQLDVAVKMITSRLGLSEARLGVHNVSSTDHPPGELIQHEADYEYLTGVYSRDFELFDYDPNLRL